MPCNRHADLTGADLDDADLSDADGLPDLLPGKLATAVS
jgi:uncharacterized protein YjbI with pentapeptide repeats